MPMGRSDQLVRAHGRCATASGSTHGTDAHMRTRTFFGLILLIAALLVAATPQLLEPSARGVEKLGIKAGVMRTPSSEPVREQRIDNEGGAIPSQMTLKGYAVDRFGGMQDLNRIGERTNQRGRLTQGEARLGMPGAQVRYDAYNPPVQSEAGVLLDIEGCPVFPANSDIAALLADPATKQRYADRAASADDPVACRTALDATINAALALPEDGDLPGDQRRRGASVRSDSQRLMLDLYANGMYEDLFAGWLDAPQTAGEIRQDLADGG